MDIFIEKALNNKRTYRNSFYKVKTKEHQAPAPYQHKNIKWIKGGWGTKSPALMNQKWRYDKLNIQKKNIGGGDKLDRNKILFKDIRN